MRYILNNEGYIYNVSFGAEISCSLGTCTEYKGKVPDDYETIEEWFDGEFERLNSWKIVDGNLVFDANRDYKLKIIHEQENNENSHVTRKELGISATDEMNAYTDLFPSHQSAGGYITSLSEKFNKVGNLPTEEVNLSLDKEQDLDLIELEFIGNNFLPNTATSSVNNGIEYTQNKDKTINISGTATDRSTLNLAGSDTSVRNILTFKGNYTVVDDAGETIERKTNYLLFGLEGLSLEFYHYDGTDRTLIGSYSGGIISFDKDTNVTQVVLVVNKGITIDTTIKPMLQVVDLEHPVMPMTKYKGNLFDEDKYFSMLTNDNGVYTGYSSLPYASYNKAKGGLGLTFKSNTAYAISFNAKNTSASTDTFAVSIVYDDDSTEQLRVIGSAWKTYKIVTNELKSICMIYFTYYNNEEFSIKEFMINEGKNYLPYKKYIGRDGQYYVDGVSTQNGTPTPESPSEIINIYKAGTYNAIADNKIYTFTIDDDLRSTPSVADRLWIDVNGAIDIERKVGKVVLDNQITLINSYTNICYAQFLKPNNFIGDGNYNYYSLYCTHASRYQVASWDDAKIINKISSQPTLNCFWIGFAKGTSLEKMKSLLNGAIIHYELKTYTTSHISQYYYEGFEYEEYKNNTTLIDLAGNDIAIKDKITIKDNQIVLIKNGLVTSETTKEEIYLGDTVMPRTYTPYTHAYCHQNVYISFKYKDPRNVDIQKISLKGLISITNVETEYNFSEEDLTKVKNYIMETGTLTDEEKELYDIDGDGIIEATDYVFMKNMIHKYTLEDAEKVISYANGEITLTPEELKFYDVNGDGVVDKLDATEILRLYYGYASNIIKGTLEINSTQSQRVLVLRDETGKILTSLGLNGMTTPRLSVTGLSADSISTGNLSIGGGKVYGEFTLYDGYSNGNIDLNGSISDYEYIEIFYCDNQQKYYGNQKIPAVNGKTTILSLTPYYIDGSNIYTYIYNGGIEINGSTIKKTGSSYVQMLNKTINSHNTSNYIYIYRVVGYK